MQPAHPSMASVRLGSCWLIGLWSFKVDLAIYLQGNGPGYHYYNKIKESKLSFNAFCCSLSTNRIIKHILNLPKRSIKPAVISQIKRSKHCCLERFCVIDQQKARETSKTLSKTHSLTQLLPRNYHRGKPIFSAFLWDLVIVCHCKAFSSPQISCLCWRVV